MNTYYRTVFGIGFGMGWGLSSAMLLVLASEERWGSVALLAGVALLCSVGIARVIYDALRWERKSEGSE